MFTHLVESICFAHVCVCVDIFFMCSIVFFLCRFWLLFGLVLGIEDIESIARQNYNALRKPTHKAHGSHFFSSLLLKCIIEKSTHQVEQQEKKETVSHQANPQTDKNNTKQRNLYSLRNSHTERETEG